MSDLQSSKVATLFVALVAIIAWSALTLEFYVEVTLARASGIALGTAIINYLSLFTILSNLLVAFGLSFSLWIPQTALGMFFSRPVVRAGIAIYIAFTCGAYNLLLRNLWNPQGLQKVSDVLLHDVVPVAYVAYWLIFASKSAMRWTNVLLWLSVPVAYMFYTLIHGWLSGWYPYPFLDAGKLGYPHALLNMSLFLCVFLGIGLFIVAIWRRHEARK